MNVDIGQCIPKKEVFICYFTNFVCHFILVVGMPEITKCCVILVVSTSHARVMEF